MAKECRKKKVDFKGKKEAGDADPKSGTANVTTKELILIDHYSAYAVP